MKKAFLCFLLTMAFILSAQAQQVVGDSTRFAQRFEAFAESLAAVDSLSAGEKVKVDSTYQAFLAEYKVVKDQLSDDDVRTCSKAKVLYQKTMTRLFLDKTGNNISRSAKKFGKKVSRAYKKTKKKLQGTGDALKE